MGLKDNCTHFSNYFEEKDPEPENSQDGHRWAKINELCHLSFAFLSKNWELRGNNVKEAEVRTDFLQLAWYFGNLLGDEAKHGL